MRPCAALTLACRLGFVVMAGTALMAAAGPGNAHAAEALSWKSEHDNAVALARQGDTAAALIVLRRLQPMHPQDVGLARDLVAVTAWSGDDPEAVRLFETLLSGPQPDYVIAAVANSYLRLGQPAEALVLYREGLARTPDDLLLAAGEIRAMTDLGQMTQALARAEADLAARGDRIEVLLAAGYAARALLKPVQALVYLDRAAALDPTDRRVIHDRIMAIDEMGAPQVARQLSDENPVCSALRRYVRSTATLRPHWCAGVCSNRPARNSALPPAIVPSPHSIS